MPSFNITNGDLRAVMSRFEKLENRLDHIVDIVNSVLAAIKPRPIKGQARGQSTQTGHSFVAGAQSLAFAINKPGASEPSEKAAAMSASVARDQQPSFMNGAAVQPLQLDWAACGFSTTAESSSCDEARGDWQTASGNRKNRRKRRRSRSDPQTVAFGSVPASLAMPESLAGSVPGPSNAPDNASIGTDQHVSTRAVESNAPVHCLSTNTTAAAVAATAPNASNAMNFAGAVAKPAKSEAAGNRLQPKRKQLFVGRMRTDGSTSTSAGGLPRITAAKPYIGKATFCVDNVAVDATEASLAYFVAAMGVDVLSCTAVKPRRSRWQFLHGITPSDRKTFCLCIPREDSSRLLNPARWPAHISLSPWVFKKKKIAQTNDDIATRGGSTASPGFDNQPNERRATHQGGATVTDGSGDGGGGRSSIGGGGVSAAAFVASGVVRTSTLASPTASHDTSAAAAEEDMDSTIIDYDGSRLS
jgi:hypothetical protein